MALKVEALLINVCARLALLMTLLVVLSLLFLVYVIGTNDESVNGAVSGTDYGSVDGTACGTVSQWIGTETLSIAYTSTISN